MTFVEQTRLRLRRWARDRLFRLAAGGGRVSSRYVVADAEWGPAIVNRRDTIIGKSLLRGGSFDPQDIEALARLVELRLMRQPHVTFVDAGANIGVCAIPLALRFAGRISVHAVEAQAEMFRLLAANVALAGAAGVVCHHRAVGDADGEVLSFLAPDYDAWNNLGGLELLPPDRSDNADMARGAREEVVTATIDSLAPDADILKLDIEGMELHALHGARRTIEANRPFVFCETHKSDEAAIIRFFAERAYRAERFRHNVIFLPAEVQPPAW